MKWLLHVVDVCLKSALVKKSGDRQGLDPVGVGGFNTVEALFTSGCNKCLGLSDHNTGVNTHT